MSSLAPPVATSAPEPPATTSAPVPPAITTTVPYVSPTPTPISTPDPYTVSPNPSEPTSTKGGKPKPTPTARGSSAPSAASSGAPVASISGGNDPTPTGTGDTGKSSSSVIGPVIGGIAGVLVLAFIVGVFVMRYKKKSSARKRRLDFLGDHSGAGAGAAGVAGAGVAVARPSSVQNSAGRPSTPGGGRPLEMAAVGGVGGAVAASHLHNEGYDYQQGYQQVPYGGANGYQGQYDQYDPYYAQQQQQQQGQAYYADQQQGYYHPEDKQGQQYQNQFVPPAPIGYGAPVNNSQGTGSPSMTHASASPKSYPQPPPSTTTGGHSSPRTPLQSAVPAPGRTSYDKNAKVESAYAGTNSPARNPQLVPENEDRIKVPV